MRFEMLCPAVVVVVVRDREAQSNQILGGPDNQANQRPLIGKTLFCVPLSNFLHSLSLRP